MPCGSNYTPPDPRRETVEVPVDGSTVTVRFGEAHPQQLGWILSMAYETKNDDCQPAFILHGQDKFLGSAQFEVGDQNGGILCTVGGRLFCPWPTLTLEFFDQNSAGSGSAPKIQIVARAVIGSEHGGASSKCRGMATQDIASTASASFTAPLGAISYWVSRPLDGGTVEVKVDDGAGETVSNYVLSADAVGYPLPAPTPWRELPPPGGSSMPQVELTNAVGSEEKFLVHWLFDLSALR